MPLPGLVTEANVCVFSLCWFDLPDGYDHCSLLFGCTVIPLCSGLRYWECGRLESIYVHQSKLFGSDVVHEDRVARTKLFGGIENSR